MREKVVLVCEVCQSRNYHTTKNKYNTPDRMETSKFCSKCNKHTIHRESK